MQTINFFMPVNLETGHPTFEHQAFWIGRAIITQDVDYDDHDYPFVVDMAEITDLFFMPFAGADAKTAQRVELPDNSNAGYKFRYKLELAAIVAYHNPKFQPGEMPDDELQNKSCPNPCSPSDWKEGGKCEKNGCYNAPAQDEPAPKPGDTVIFPTVTADDIKEARIPESYVNKVIELIGTSTQVFFVDTNNYDAPFEAGYFEVECATESGLVFPLQWLRK